MMLRGTVKLFRLSGRPTVGEVSRLRLSPSESRFTRLLLVTLLWGPLGPCCSSPAGHADLSAGLRPFQSTALWEEWKEEKGQPRLSSAGSKPPSPPSPPGLSSPQSEPTELLNDSEEILRDDEDMVVVRKRRRRMVMTVVVLRVMMMLQSVPYHVHLYAGESSDSGGEGGKVCLYKYVCIWEVGLRACEIIPRSVCVYVSIWDA